MSRGDSLHEKGEDLEAELAVGLDLCWVDLNDGGKLGSHGGNGGSSGGEGNEMERGRWGEWIG